MKPSLSIYTFVGLVSIFCLTLTTVALPPFIGNDAIPVAAPVAQTNYFYWQPTNELVSFNGAPGVTYPGYLETVSDATNTTVEITTNANSWSLLSCVVGQFATNVAVVQTLNFQ